jgi:hypothetical protein
MSTLNQRLENRCLNCESLTHGRYCQVCGQENVEHKMTFFSMIKHFVFDLLHFDGKFFNTLATLFKKPGIVPLDFTEGKRVKHLEPFRMYIFTSTVFFILYFAFFNNPESSVIKFDNDSVAKDSIANKSFSFGSGTKKNSRNFEKFNTYEEFEKDYAQSNSDRSISFVEKLGLKKIYYYNKKYKTKAEIGSVIQNEILHKIPQIIFCIMPFFVGILRLLYVRNKKLVYSDHGVFALFMFSFTYIYLFIAMCIFRLGALSNNNIVAGIIALILFIGYNVYFYLSMLGFYQQSKSKTLVKFFGVVILNWFVSIFVVLIFLVISFLFF